MKVKIKRGWQGYTSWYLLPTIRMGGWRRGMERGGWFIAIWLKYDFGLTWERGK